MSRETLITRRAFTLAVMAGVLLLATSCSNAPTSAYSNLHLRAVMGKSEFFEGEPLYVVFSLTNDGADTAWSAPYGLTGWFLHGNLSEEQTGQIPEWGFVVDYAFPQAYRGEPLAPGAVKYHVALIQDDWGVYSPEMRILYVGHHLLPGRYELLPIFDVDGWRGPSMSRPIEGTPVTFVVRARSDSEDLVLEHLQQFAAMSDDPSQRPAFTDSLVALVASRAPEDPFLPFLVGECVGIAMAVDSAPDSAGREVLATASIAASRAQRFTAGGANAVASVSYYRPSALPALARELAGSLAGLVASSLTHDH